MTTTERSTSHATFSLERVYDAAPHRVFSAFADPAIKARWFRGPDEGPTDHQLDFRVGGREISRGHLPDGPTFTFEAYYADIVPDQRIVTTYCLDMDQTRLSVSVSTVELQPAGSGTRLVYTEQGTYLDGHDTPAEREHGTRELLDALGTVLAQLPETV